MSSCHCVINICFNYLIWTCCAATWDALRFSIIFPKITSLAFLFLSTPCTLLCFQLGIYLVHSEAIVSVREISCQCALVSLCQGGRMGRQCWPDVSAVQYFTWLWKAKGFIEGRERRGNEWACVILKLESDKVKKRYVWIAASCCHPLHFQPSYHSVRDGSALFPQFVKTRSGKVGRLCWRFHNNRLEKSCKSQPNKKTVSLFFFLKLSWLSHKYKIQPPHPNDANPANEILTRLLAHKLRAREALLM